MKRHLILLFLLLFPLISMAQYPFLIKKGESKAVKSNEFNLYVLKESQFDKALADSKELKIIKQEVDELKKLIDKQGEKDNTEDELITTLKKDRDYYKNLYETSSKDIETLGIENKKLSKEIKKQKLYRNIAIVAIPVAFVIGILL